MARRDFNNAMREFSPGGKRAYAISGRAQTREIPGLYEQQLAAQQANAFDPGGGQGGGSTPAALAPGSAGGVGGGAPADIGLEGYFGPEQEQDFFYQEDYGYRPQSDGGRGQDDPSEDAQGFRGQSPLSDLDKDILSALGQVPGFGLATNITRAADYFGLGGVIGPTNPTSFGRPGTPEFRANIEAMRAAQELSKREREMQALADGTGDSIGGYGVGGAAFGDPGGGFDQGYGPQAAPEPGPTTGGYSIGGYNVGGGLSYGGQTGSSFGGDGGAGQGSPGGGSGGHGGQAGEGAGSGNSADGGRGDSPGYHEGGYVSEDLIPGELRGDVPTVLQEHEQVLTADATEMLGPGFAEGVNMMASLQKRRRAKGL